MARPLTYLRALAMQEVHAEVIVARIVGRVEIAETEKRLLLC